MEPRPLPRRELSPDPPAKPSKARLVRVDALRPEGYEGSCLRPLGLCELGGACDGCWYNPDKPRPG